MNLIMVPEHYKIGDSGEHLGIHINILGFISTSWDSYQHLGIHINIMGFISTSWDSNEYVGVQNIEPLHIHLNPDVKY